jgi:hypothetical protein
MPKAKSTATCSVYECGGMVRGYGLCSKHYQRAYLFGRLNKEGEPEEPFIIPKRALDDRREHELYSLWWARKNAGILCQAWAKDFWTFVNDVGQRPSHQHFFVPLDGHKAIGPDNFEWREKMYRMPGETKKAWIARQWQNRRANYPNFEANRYLKRKYGITLADYEKMRDAQGDRCAICREPETSYDTKTHAIRALSVDHCHNTLKVRELLCFRCNSTIGRLRDNIVLLDACRAYLVKHSTTEN